MDEQSMLPFRDMPVIPSKRTTAGDRSKHGRLRSTKPLDAGFVSALADSSRVVFLDVETTGLSWYYDDITVVGWMKAGNYDFHVAGETPARLAAALATAAALVT